MVVPGGWSDPRGDVPGFFDFTIKRALGCSTLVVCALSTPFANPTPAESATLAAARPAVRQGSFITDHTNAPSRASPDGESFAHVTTVEARVASVNDFAREFAPDAVRVGSASLGSPNRGFLVNGVQMPDGPYWRVLDRDRAWGTAETITSLLNAIGRVHAAFPDSPALYVGNISAEDGGYLRPHHSHQSGRDADLGYYYFEGSRWYARVNARNLDRPRTWALVKALLSDPNVEDLFMDRFVQNLLRSYAKQVGEDPEFVAGAFDGGLGQEKRVFHAWGHLTHMHVRFRCPRAVAAGVGTIGVSRQSRTVVRSAHRHGRRT